MKRKTSVLTTLLVAILTFGTLFATVGPRHHGGNWNCHQQSCHSRAIKDKVPVEKGPTENKK
jgi:hypothetical protein